ncbi:MAG TPA: 50S ribosomal protein L10 [Solirubrobacteraceae bacterium]|nr:50S ribosomal protein L10 [Solirubrobacteraceae bacterium]
MNRDEKAVAIAEIADQIEGSSAIFAVDYRGISVPEAAELRSRLRDADATFKVVKNSLTERAADRAGAETLKPFLTGPTALTFVRGDVAVAAKAIADQARATQLLAFKGGLMDGAPLDSDQIRSISRLPSRDALYGQLVGIVASPVAGLVRTLNALVSGLAVALGQVQEKKASGEIHAPELPAESAAAADAAPAAADEPPTDEAPAEETAAAPAEEASAPDVGAPEAEVAAGQETPAAEEAPAEKPAEEAEAHEEPAAAPDGTAEPEGSAAHQAEPEQEQPAQADDNQADVSAEAESDDAESPTKED